MNKSLGLLMLGLLFAATGCNQQKFIKDADGSEHKIIRNESGKKAVPGDFMEVSIVAKYGDSTMFSSAESSQPRFIPYDTMQMPPYFKEVHEGDSLVIRQLTDSLIKSGQAAPFMQKGKYIMQTFKIVKLFPNKEAADSVAKTFEPAAKIYNSKKVEDQIEKEMVKDDSLVKADDKIISDYMAQHNLKGNKTKWGTYVIIDSAGTGPMITNKDVVEVNYTGRTFNDSTFDSNTNPKFGHPEPLYVDMSEYRVIPGWVDGLKLMQKGSVGRMIIPSWLAYGKNGAPPRIGPNENLIFDMKVTDVLDQAAYQKIQEKQQEQMNQQRQMMEQLQRQMQEQQKNKQQPKGK